MNMTGFDTLKAAKSLQDSSFAVQRAEAVVEVLAQHVCQRDELPAWRVGTHRRRAGALGEQIGLPHP